MFKRINFSTPYTKTSLSELKELANKKNELAKVELVLRSFKGIIIHEVSRAEAMTICDNEIAINPKNSFFNLARALHEKDKQKKQAFLLAAINAKDHPLSGAAAYCLAETYESDRHQHIEFQAWVTKAILLKSKEADEDFLGSVNNRGYLLQGYFSVLRYYTLPATNQNTACDDKDSRRSVWALSQCIFLAVTLSGGEFSRLSGSAWLSFWNYDSQELYLKAAFNGNPLENLGKTSNIQLAAQHALRNDPYIFYNFFDYCYQNKIISKEVYFHILQFLLMNSPEHDPLIKNNSKISYDLSKFYAEKKHFIMESLNNLKECSTSNSIPIDMMPFIKNGFSSANVNQETQVITEVIPPPPSYDGTHMLVPPTMPLSYDLSQVVHPPEQSQAIQSLYPQINHGEITDQTMLETNGESISSLLETIRNGMTINNVNNNASASKDESHTEEKDLICFDDDEEKSERLNQRFDNVTGNKLTMFSVTSTNEVKKEGNEIKKSSVANEGEKPKLVETFFNKKPSPIKSNDSTNSSSNTNKKRVLIPS